MSCQTSGDLVVQRNVLRSARFRGFDVVAVRLRVAVEPSDEPPRRDGAAQRVFSRDVQGSIAGRAVRQHHGVVPRREVVHGHVTSQRRVPEETNPGVAQNALEPIDDRFRRRVVGGDARADQTERHGALVQDVDARGGAVVRQKPVRRVHARGAAAHHAEQPGVPRGEILRGAREPPKRRVSRGREGRAAAGSRRREQARQRASRHHRCHARRPAATRCD
mmetsp:Transcript_5882/g.24964  ORF Transcript_5882/g.24964 Transcript_5882/m.24964 type:complete len:220 (-) Transcript_5882:34-693(-)